MAGHVKLLLDVDGRTIPKEEQLSNTPLDTLLYSLGDAKIVG